VRKNSGTVAARAKGLYHADKMLDLHRSSENHEVTTYYERVLGKVGGPKAHALLHTTFQSRARMEGASLKLVEGSQPAALAVTVCVGTSCHVRGAQTLLRKLISQVESAGIADRVEVQASFCHEACDKGPTVVVGDTTLHKTTPEQAFTAILAALQAKTPPAPAPEAVYGK
jgi:NADH-quinone oxidoreductase subunit G